MCGLTCKVEASHARGDIAIERAVVEHARPVVDIDHTLLIEVADNQVEVAVAIHIPYRHTLSAITSRTKAAHTRSDATYDWAIVEVAHAVVQIDHVLLPVIAHS